MSEKETVAGIEESGFDNKEHGDIGSDESCEFATDRVDHIISTVDKILSLLKDIDAAHRSGTKFNHEFLSKVLRPTFIQAENLLPDLRDLCDDLDFKNDERHLKLAELLEKLECEGIEPLLPLIDSLRQDNI